MPTTTYSWRSWRIPVDGNLHPLLTAPTTEANGNLPLARLGQAADALVRAALKLGGTISGRARQGVFDGAFRSLTKPVAAGMPVTPPARAVTVTSWLVDLPTVSCGPVLPHTGGPNGGTLSM